MDQQQASVLVLGANGRLGRAVVAAFAAAGWRVRAQVRQQEQASEMAWRNNVEICCCDARDQDALRRIANGVQVVVNALNPGYTEWQLHARVLGDNAIAAARDQGALLMFPGNVYNFGRQLPARLRPDTPQVGNTSTARIRIDMEAALRAAAKEGMDSVVLRAGDYLGGSQRGAWFDLAIAKDLHKGNMIYPGPLDRVHAWNYLPDFADVFVRVATQRARLRGFHCFHVPGHAITGAQLQQAMEEVVGQRVHVRKLPWWGLQLTAPFSAMSRAILEIRYLWYRPQQLVDTALRDLIGTWQETPLVEAVHTSLQELNLFPVQETLRHA
jgi:nucleoside-diphosphate-sugar epimerase